MWILLVLPGNVLISRLEWERPLWNFVCVIRRKGDYRQGSANKCRLNMNHLVLRLSTSSSSSVIAPKFLYQIFLQFSRRFVLQLLCAPFDLLIFCILPVPPNLDNYCSSHLGRVMSIVYWQSRYTRHTYHVNLNVSWVSSIHSAQLVASRFTRLLLQKRAPLWPLHSLLCRIRQLTGNQRDEQEILLEKYNKKCWVFRSALLTHLSGQFHCFGGWGFLLWVLLLMLQDRLGFRRNPDIYRGGLTPFINTTECLHAI